MPALPWVEPWLGRAKRESGSSFFVPGGGLCPGWAERLGCRQGLDQSGFCEVVAVQQTGAVTQGDFPRFPSRFLPGPSSPKLTALVSKAELMQEEWIPCIPACPILSLQPR